MNPKVIGNVIKSFREERRLSQEVLSGLANIDRSHLSKIELGVRSPTVNALYKIADALNIKASNILVAAEKEESKNIQVTDNDL
ncbi:helix-turn-helix domain-containing protein [Massiliimalia massiliensis]|uniref:helix-turn-helix domain-containing protein n=1 Tax=Massiliimalia massiliensis TaxID=1852384 RepID=UPI00098449A8|nr:helix-turn-helix transcriptional regulator [Massiliimalia massiliensis]